MIDEGGAFEIPLTRGLVTVVDEVDFVRFGGASWYATNHGPRGSYAARKPWSTKTLEYLHRAILEPPAGLVVDHINGDRLDNRRANLRLCTQQQNTLNGPGRTGRYRGVAFDAPNQKWSARIKSRGVDTWLGRWKTEEEAARAYDHHARILHGEFARLNFPDADPCPATGSEMAAREYAVRPAGDDPSPRPRQGDQCEGSPCVA